MREIKELFVREFRNDRIDSFEENTNVMSSIDDTNQSTIRDIAENQPAVYENKMLIKHGGVLKEFVLEDNNIILKEIE